MRYLFSFLSIAVFCMLSSCGTNKGSNSVQQIAEEENAEEKTEVSDVDYVIAKVVISDEGCSQKLIPENTDNVCYYPVNLEEKFKVDGAYLQFKKYPSRAPMPAECGSCQSIQIESVVRLKR